MRRWIFLILCAVIFLGVPRGALSNTFDETVRRWIVSAVTGGPPFNDEAAVAFLAVYLDANKYFEAWAKLKECRDAGDTQDLMLASATHYTFARSYASEVGARDIEDLPSLYNWAKENVAEISRNEYLGFLEDVLANTENPTAPPDERVMLWGVRGARDGLRDYETRTGNSPLEFGPLSQLVLGFIGYYTTRVVDEDPSVCRVGLQ